MLCTMHCTIHCALKIKFTDLKKVGSDTENTLFFFLPKGAYLMVTSMLLKYGVQNGGVYSK